MRLRSTLVAVALMVTLGAGVFYFFQRQLSGASLAFGVHPEVVEQLETALETTREAARLDPERQAEYRARFDDLERTRARLAVLERSRGELVRRYQLLLLGIFAASVVLATGAWAYRQSRHGPRLEKLRRALEELAAGSSEVRVGVKGRDTIGRIAAMVEQTSRRMARDRRRLAALKNLSAWQEAARRHAHEMRTPLTGARLEISRVLELAEEALSGNGDDGGPLRRAAQGALEELDRLGGFTRRFTSFARLPEPELRRQDLGALLADFVETYGGAWPNLELRVDGEGGLEVLADRDMLRQVLVNLCENSSQALGKSSGTVVLSADAAKDAAGTAAVEVRDDGPGIAEAVRSRLFEPYTTTRTVGEGMGLGLAISKKILLDHGGDLELVASSQAGTTFRLTLPRPPAVSCIEEGEP